MKFSDIKSTDDLIVAINEAHTHFLNNNDYTHHLFNTNLRAKIALQTPLLYQHIPLKDLLNSCSLKSTISIISKSRYPGAIKSFNKANIKNLNSQLYLVRKQVSELEHNLVECEKNVSSLNEMKNSISFFTNKIKSIDEKTTRI